jgi:hypothetical protein
MINNHAPENKGKEENNGRGEIIIIKKYVASVGEKRKNFFCSSVFF